MLAVLWLLRFSMVDVCFGWCMAVVVTEGLVDQAREEDCCPCDSLCCGLSWSADCRSGTLPVSGLSGLLSSSDTTEKVVVVVDEEAKLVLHLVSIECRRLVGANTTCCLFSWFRYFCSPEEVDVCDRILVDAC